MAPPGRERLSPSDRWAAIPPPPLLTLPGMFPHAHNGPACHSRRPAGCFSPRACRRIVFGWLDGMRGHRRNREEVRAVVDGPHAMQDTRPERQKLPPRAPVTSKAVPSMKGRPATSRPMFLRQRFDLERSEVGVAGAEIGPELYDGLAHGRDLGPNTPAKPSPSGADPRPARRLALSLHMPPPTIQQAVGRSTRGKFSWTAVVLD